MAIFSTAGGWLQANLPAIFTIPLLLLLSGLFYRPAFPKGAPKRSTEDWPIFGSPRFFSEHGDFNLRGLARTAINNFSFYLGKHQVVSIGAKGRMTYFDSNALNAGEGYATLFTGTPQRQSPAKKARDSGEYQSKFGKTIILLLKKTYLSRRTPVMAADVRGSMERLLTKAAHSSAVMKPFEDIYRIVWQQTNRLVGADEVANSPEQLNRVLCLFEDIAEGASPLRVMFPMIPTLQHVKRMVAGARLHGILQGFVDGRRASGRKEDDALQFLIDAGENPAGITEFIAGGLFAGQLNTGVNAAWLLIYLATNEKWYKEIRKEVESALLRHGADEAGGAKSALETLSRFSLEDWTGEFPMIDLCLKETIRFQLPGTFCRKNTSGKHLPISGSDEIIPKDAYVPPAIQVFLTDNCHFNSDIYSRPLSWDPGRYLEGRAEDKKEPHAYLGWGVGRHSCLGMVAAQMEVTMVVAFFFALFDFQLLDDQGKHTIPDRNRFGAGRPRDWNPRLQYKLRYPENAVKA
ncbi:Putative cytochrome P450 [Colletotrichum destructivum]|uniref:Cytochrome P450 n=1 Tax=Colletotrichum destructivum TaxID=34406 RepID=A0AAX4ICU2_9PEZI|nr:Putative cytochrome P450 [Colletotrichum destructivum]